jgi:hypothetical protein
VTTAFNANKLNHEQPLLTRKEKVHKNNATLEEACIIARKLFRIGVAAKNEMIRCGNWLIYGLSRPLNWINYENT